MSYRDLRYTLRKMRGKMTRAEIADRAATLPGAPGTITEERIRQLEDLSKNPPKNGAEFRAIVAATGVCWIEALRQMGYWPPIPSPYTEDPATQILEEAVDMSGGRITRSGRQIVIHLP